jgi:hypothetical protein
MVVLLVEHGLPASLDFHREVLDRDQVDSGEIFVPHPVGHAVALWEADIGDDLVEPGLLAQLAFGRLSERLAVLDHAGDHMPIVLDGAMEHQEVARSPDDDRDLAGSPQSAATAS